VGVLADAVRGSFVHEALLYQDADEFLAGILPFVAGGLDAGEPVLIAVPGPRIDVIADVLGPAAMPIRFMDMSLAGDNPGRIIPWVLYPFLAEYQGRRVRIVGEPVWAGRSHLEYPACAQHEAMINIAFHGSDASILCPYDTRELEPHMIEDTFRTHPVMVRGERREDSHGYAPDDVVEEYNLPLDEVPAGAATLTFGGDGLPAVRDFVALHGGQAGLDRRRVAELQLATNELATNAVTHGGGKGTLSMWRSGLGVFCEVRDDGHATERLVGRVPPAVDSLSGRGLVLVNYLCDLVRPYCGPDGTVVRVLLRG
jgi:anti-sigma regulatory factor (Ser/Thr protein kinase)